MILFNTTRRGQGLLIRQEQNGSVLGWIVKNDKYVYGLNLTETPKEMMVATLIANYMESRLQ